MRQVDQDGKLAINASVNGEPRTFTVDPRTTLADALRYELKLTGTKVGCEHGVCGACTILVDSEPVRSCLMLGLQAEGCELRTIEGLTEGRTLGPLQDSFQRHHALQCGYCSSGFLAIAQSLLHRNPRPTREEVRDTIAGNFCRCTGYETIVDAICDPAVGDYYAEIANE